MSVYQKICGYRTIMSFTENVWNATSVANLRLTKARTSRKIVIEVSLENEGERNCGSRTGEMYFMYLY